MLHCLIQQLLNLLKKSTFSIQQPSRITLWIWNITFLEAFPDAQDPLLSFTDTDRAFSIASYVMKENVHLILFYYLETEPEVAARALKILN